MKSVSEKAFAKINLSIDVTGKREDGYHLLKMIMQTLDLHDTVTIDRCESGISVSCNDGSVPLDRTNTAYRAARHLCRKYGIMEGVRIRIDKRIPLAAGLGGGSADAAAVYRGMNRLFSLGEDKYSLSGLSVKTGADVPYCVIGGTALVEGIGERVTPLAPLPSVDVVLVNPGFAVSTAEVYGHFRMDKMGKKPDTEMLIDAIRRKDICTVARNMANVLEEVTTRKHRVIADIKKKLLEAGAEGSLMSGSGPTVFGIFLNSQTAEKAAELMKRQGYRTILTQMTCEESC